MPKATPASVAIPYSGNETGFTANNQDATNATLGPSAVLLDPSSSQPITPAYAPIYPRAAVWHRAGQLVASGGLATVDTLDNAHDPTAVPTWIGLVNVTLASGGTVLHVVPLGNYGAPPASGNAYLGAGAGATDEVATISASAGGAGSDYTITVGATGQTHTLGDYVIVLAVGGVSTNTTSSVPSGPVGGPGSQWVDFDMALTPSSALATATVMPRKWSPLHALWMDTVTQSLATPSTTVAAQQVVRIQTNGFWYYCQLTAITGASAVIKIAATVG